MERLTPNAVYMIRAAFIYLVHPKDAITADVSGGRASFNNVMLFCFEMKRKLDSSLIASLLNFKTSIHCIFGAQTCDFY